MTFTRVLLNMTGGCAQDSMVQLSQLTSHPQRVQNRGQAFVLKVLNSTTASELCEWAVDIVKSKACPLRVFPAIHMPITTTTSFFKSSLSIYSVLFFSFKDFNLEVLICCNLSGLANKPTTNELFEILERFGS